MHKEPQLLDVVALLSDLPEHGLVRGQVGELLSNLVYGVNDSSGFPAVFSLIDAVDKLDAGDDVGELLEAA